jgi:hypothetical protein
MAKRLNWGKAAQTTKVLRKGSSSGYDELPPVGSYADKSQYWTRGRLKIGPKPQTTLTTVSNSNPKRTEPNSKVLRRRQGAETVELVRKPKS